MDVLLESFLKPLLTENLGWFVGFIVIYYSLKSMNARIDSLELNIKSELNNGIRRDIRHIQAYQEESRSMQEQYARELVSIKATCEERHKREF
jgi:hypothetical protein